MIPKQLTYHLIRDGAGPRVMVQDLMAHTQHRLEPDQSQHLVNHSPDGFEWGYAGSGPAQLALAILADWLERNNILPSLALQWYQDFKDTFIATMPEAGGSITSNQIENFIYHEKSQTARGA